ncbi:uncharacterized protein (DUF2345 family) [Curtobacterium flaccumfaciens]|uniref:Uncharacterized protein (DUF2345 family) n=1 Tax=Curtobacterium salicis TaxID=1779862 RepID=A0ABX0T603_9MICO|nr:DUF3060 domain-containing protein [Curtobacterium sp. WW7]NII40930.1 uncharacterized protein (DUF2345 family) [Curtobacterium sp. WW7]
MRSRTIAAVIAVGVSATLLAGCSSTSPKPEPTATKSIAAPDGQTPAPYENACDGKQAVLSGDGTKHELPKGCDAVSVVSSGSTITLGATKSIVVEGSNNDITVESTDDVTLMGSNNKVHVEGDKPEVNDTGTGNTVQ